MKPKIQSEPGHNLVQIVTPSNVQTGQTWFNPTDNTQQVWNGIGPTGNKWVKDKGNTSNGYSFGASSGSASLSIIEKLNFSSGGVASLLSKNLGQPNYAAGAFNSNLAGYITGGAYDPGATTLSKIQKFLFSELSNSTIIGNLSCSKNEHNGFNSSSFGYSVFGANYAGNTFFSTLERIAFSSDGNASLLANLNVAGAWSCSCNSSTYGYVLGRTTYSSSYTFVSSIHRLTFSSDTTMPSVGGLSAYGRYVTYGFNSSTTGYSAGGFDGVSTNLSYVEKLDFPFNSGTATLGGNLAIAIFSAGCCGMNSTTYGYVAGGYTSAVDSSIQSLYFPFNSGVSTVIGNLAGNSTYGNQSSQTDSTDFVVQFV